MDALQHGAARAGSSAEARMSLTAPLLRAVRGKAAAIPGALGCSPAALPLRPGQAVRGAVARLLAGDTLRPRAIERRSRVPARPRHQQSYQESGSGSWRAHSRMAERALRRARVTRAGVLTEQPRTRLVLSATAWRVLPTYTRSSTCGRPRCYIYVTAALQVALKAASAARETEKHAAGCVGGRVLGSVQRLRECGGAVSCDAARREGRETSARVKQSSITPVLQTGYAQRVKAWACVI